MLVSAPTPATFGNGQALAIRGQISDQLIRYRIIDQRAGWYFDDHIRSGFSRHIVLAAASAILGSETRHMPEGRQGVQVSGHFENDIPTPAAIAAIRPATRDELFAVEMDSAISTAAGTNQNTCLINEH